MTKTRAFKFDTKTSLFPGKGTFLQNLFLRNEPNLSSQKLTANPCGIEGYNDFHPKTKNGTNPNEPNLKPILNTPKTSLLPDKPANLKKLFFAKRTQFERPKSVASNCYRKVYDALLQKGNEPKRTQLKPINPIQTQWYILSGYFRAVFTSVLKVVSCFRIWSGLSKFSSMIFTMRLPIITPSAPADATCLACSGELIPKPTHIGVSVAAFSLAMSGFTRSDNSLLAPVTP